MSALALALPFYWHRNLPTSLPPEKSIAVLPFENLSKDEENVCNRAGVIFDPLSRAIRSIIHLTKVCDLKTALRVHLFCASFGVRTRPRVAFRIVKTFAKESTCDSKLVCARVGHTRHHITSRLAAFT
jgi:hypothetical protein